MIDTVISERTNNKVCVVTVISTLSRQTPTITTLVILGHRILNSSKAKRARRKTSLTKAAPFIIIDARRTAIKSRGLTRRYHKHN